MGGRPVLVERETRDHEGAVVNGLTLLAWIMGGLILTGCWRVAVRITEREDES